MSLPGSGVDASQTESQLRAEVQRFHCVTREYWRFHRSLQSARLVALRCSPTGLSTALLAGLLVVRMLLEFSKQAALLHLQIEAL